MFKSFCLLGLSAMILTSAMAWSDPKYVLDTAQGTTSDDLRLSQFWFGYISDPIDPFWPYKTQTAARSNWSLLGRHVTVDRPGYAYSATDLLLGTTSRINDAWTLHGAVGGSLLNYETQSKGSSHFIGEAEATYSDQEVIWASFRFAEQFNFPRILPLSGDPLSSKGEVAEPRLLLQPIKKLRIQAKNQVAWLEDKNRRIWSDAQIMWGLSSHPIWLWIGVGGEHLQNSKVNGNYWSPDRFYSYGPRIDSSFPVGSQLQLFVGGSLNRLRESNFDEGDGHYLRSGIRYGGRERALFEIMYESNASTQSGRTWKSDSLGFSINTNW